MKKSVYNKKRLMILVCFLMLFFLPIMFTVAKYVVEKTDFFNLNLKGVAFNSTNLVSSDIEYTDSKEVLLNPERGFYTHNSIVIPETDINTVLISNANSVISDMQQNNDTLALTVFYLSNYANSDLSDDVINALNNFCGIFRKKGYKLIVRFAYFGDDTTYSDPDNFSQIISHIEQLQSFFTTNKDVIHLVQLGFIGKWGEWHTSPYAETQYRSQVIDKMLEILPQESKISVRKPAFYKEYFSDGYFDTKLGLVNNLKNRIGIYDDGYLSTITDYGTYETHNREEELKWMEYLTRYTAFGGETIYNADYEGYYDTTNAIYNMNKTHTNYLNRLYHSHIINLWKTNKITSNEDLDYVDYSLYDYFKNKLGYRFLLTDAKLPSYNVKQGEYLHLSFDINNIGFGNLIKNRPVKLIIEKDDKYYINITTIDPRTWYSSNTTKEQLVFKIPGNIETGEWNVYLQLPDSNNTLIDSSNYYIKFANSDIWNYKLNANYIGSFVVEEKINNTDNGFYQVNSVNIESEEQTPLNEIVRTITIDGQITTSIEWTDDDIVYNEDSEKVYLYSDDEYLYVYTKSSVTPDNVDVRIATDAAASATSYNFVAQNSRLYYYDNGYGDKITSISFTKDDCIEERIPLASLGITSLSDIKGIEVVYMSGWNAVKRFDFELVDEPEPVLTGIYIDGKMTHENEYTSSDIFYNEGTTTIYIKTDDNFVYVYAYDSSLDGTENDIGQTSLFMGSSDNSKPKDAHGYMIWSETSLLGCNNSGCNDATYSAYTSDRSIYNGAEFKIAKSSLGVSSISDIRNVKIWWRSSSYSDIKTTSIVYEEKLYPSDVTGKTVAFAHKPSNWTYMYMYAYDEAGNNISGWPGVQMTKYVDGTNDDIYAYIFDDNISDMHVIFSNNGSSQVPTSGYDILLIKDGQQKIWDGTMANVKGWTNFDNSVSNDKNIYFKFQIPSGYNQTKACAHIYYDGGDLTGGWPGYEMTLNNDYWEYTFNNTNNYAGLKVILNNCKLSTTFKTTSLDIKSGITVKNVNNKWYVIDDN